MTVSLFLVFFASFFLGLIFMFAGEKMATRYRILMHKNIPHIGGIAFGLAFIVTSSVWFYVTGNLSKDIQGFLYAALAMFFFGLCDDFRELSVPVKFLGQSIPVMILILSGVTTHIAYIGEFWNIIITVLWVVGITNSFNLLDIGDGLAAGVAVLVGISFSVLCFFSGNSTTFVLSLIVSGSLIGFLSRNLPPAKIYMGNCGSHFLGFVLAVLAIMVHYAGLSNKIALLSPVLILWLPLWDTGLLIALRLSKKRIPFFKSRDHVYLRFLSLGYSRMKALKIMIALCAAFCLCGIFLAKVPFMFGGALIAVAGFLTAVVSIRISKVEIDG